MVDMGISLKELHALCFHEDYLKFANVKRQFINQLFNATLAIICVKGLLLV